MNEAPKPMRIHGRGPGCPLTPRPHRHRAVSAKMITRLSRVASRRPVTWGRLGATGASWRQRGARSRRRSPSRQRTRGCQLDAGDRRARPSRQRRDRGCLRAVEHREQQLLAAGRVVRQGAVGGATIDAFENLVGLVEFGVAELAEPVPQHLELVVASQRQQVQLTGDVPEEGFEAGAASSWVKPRSSRVRRTL